MRFLIIIAILMLGVTAYAAAYPPATITSDTDDITVGNLDCGTTYEIRVRERNNGVFTNSNTYQKATLPCPTPTPTPTPSPTPTPTPTPTATPTPSPTPTATPTPTPTPQPGFPDDSNTGVPAGTTLTPYSGENPVRTNGAVIDSKSIQCIHIEAQGVVIKNSAITCPNSADHYAVYSQDNSSQPSVTIQDSSIDCLNTNGNATGEANFTLRRVKITGCENGGDVNQNYDVQDSYVKMIYNGGGAHADGFQMACGHFQQGASGCGTNYALGAKNVHLIHNTILSIDDQGAYGTSAMISNRLTNGNVNGPDQDIVINSNLLAYGSYPLYCEQDGAHYINGQVTNNAFIRGAFGYSADCSDEVQSGNYDYFTGQPITLP